MLNLYLVRRDIERDQEPDFDATHGFVIVAESEAQARMFAADYRAVAHDARGRDDSREVWMSDTTTVILLGTPDPSFKPGVVLEDHQWG